MDGWRGHTEERAAGVVLGPGQCPICNRINTEVDTFQVSETASAYKSRDVLPFGRRRSRRSAGRILSTIREGRQGVLRVKASVKMMQSPALAGTRCSHSAPLFSGLVRSRQSAGRVKFPWTTSPS